MSKNVHLDLSNVGIDIDDNDFAVPEDYADIISYFSNLSKMWSHPPTDEPSMKVMVYRIAHICAKYAVLHFEAKRDAVPLEENERRIDVDRSMLPLFAFFPNAFISFEQKENQLADEDDDTPSYLDYYDVFVTHNLIKAMWNRYCEMFPGTMEFTLEKLKENELNPGTIKSVFLTH